MEQSLPVGRDSYPDNDQRRLMDSHPGIDLDPETVNELRQTLASYLSHFKHAQSHRLVTALFEKNAWLNVIFAVTGDTIRERLKPPRKFRSFQKQWNFFKYRLKGAMLFVKMGKFIELYNEDALAVQRICGLAASPKTRGMKNAVGALISHFRELLRRVLAEGHRAAYLAEGDAGQFVRHRYARWIVGRDSYPDNTKYRFTGFISRQQGMGSFAV